MSFVLRRGLALVLAQELCNVLLQADIPCWREEEAHRAQEDRNTCRLRKFRLRGWQGLSQNYEGNDC